MFFVLSKTLDLLLDPWWWAFGSLTTGVWLLRGPRRRWGVGLVSWGFFVWVVFSLPSVANRLWQALEADATSTMRADTTYDAIVLLGGTVSPLGALPDSPAWNDNVERLSTTYDLLRMGKARAVIVTGGSLGTDTLPTEADYLARQLEAWGIEKDRIVLEPRALNTRENATYTADLVRQHGFTQLLLVTSAFHMPRAVGCFRAVNLPVDTLVVDYRMRHPSLDPHVLPRAEYLKESSQALRELFGRWVYRLRGYSQ